MNLRFKLFMVLSRKLFEHIQPYFFPNIHVLRIGKEQVLLKSLH